MWRPPRQKRKERRTDALKYKNASVPSGARPRRRLFGGALRGALVVALGTAGWSSASPPAGASSEAPAQAASQAGPVWVCRPGQAADPCASSLAATAVTAAGVAKPATWPHSALASNFDCFYVRPTNSLATTANTGFTVTKLESLMRGSKPRPFLRCAKCGRPPTAPRPGQASGRGSPATRP